jgi:hypothetical protein
VDVGAVICGGVLLKLDGCRSVLLCLDLLLDPWWFRSVGVGFLPRSMISTPGHTAGFPTSSVFCFLLASPFLATFCSMVVGCVPKRPKKTLYFRYVSNGKGSNPSWKKKRNSTK